MTDKAMSGKKMNTPAAIAMAVVLITAAQAVPTPAATPAVQLWPQAVVQGEKILLSDVAGVVGFDSRVAQTIRQIEVAAAPAPGESECVDVEQVRKALAAARVNLANLCIGGSAACNVYRPASAANEPTRASGKKASDPMAARDEPRTVEAAVRRDLAGRLAKFGGQVEVRFAAASKGVLDLGGKGVTFNVRPRGSALLGLVNFDVDLVETGKVARTVPVMAEVALTLPVVVARRSINRGAMVRAEDLGMEERRFSRIESIGLTATSAVLGHEAKRYIDRGEMVLTRDVQAMPLVRRGDYVTVWFHRGGLVVRGSAKALKEGAQGERIEVKSEPGGQVYTVVVTGPKTVEAGQVDGDGALSRAE